MTIIRTGGAPAPLAVCALVGLLTGCLMEALFREINFATVRVLVENNVRVVIPASPLD